MQYHRCNQNTLSALGAAGRGDRRSAFFHASLIPGGISSGTGHLPCLHPTRFTAVGSASAAPHFCRFLEAEPWHCSIDFKLC
jgi:hypothetical protein